MNDALMSLIDWHAHPRRVIESGGKIITPGDPVDTLLLLERGTARSSDDTSCAKGEILLLCEALALSQYQTAITAIDECHLISFEQTVLRRMLVKGGEMVWPLSRSIAAEVTKRRLAS